MISAHEAKGPSVYPKTNDHAPEDFFDGLHRAFLLAEKNTPGSAERFYLIGGHRISLRFAGPALLSLIVPALEHLSCPKFPGPELTICVFDSVSTGAEIPPPAWPVESYGPRGEITGFNTCNVSTNMDLGSCVLNILQRDINTGIFWVRDAKRLPYWESGAPLRMILHWWLLDRGVQLLHGSAVGTDKKGVLLAGRGGSGKSTAALTCLNSQLLYAADDYCLLKAEPVPFVHSLYSSGKVNAADAGKFSFLKGSLSNPDKLDNEKALFFLSPRFRDKISKGFPVKAVLIPRVTGRPGTTLSPASPGQALKALAPSTIFQLSGAGNSAFKIISSVVKRLPCYYLDLGTDISEIPRVILGLLEGV